MALSLLEIENFYRQYGPMVMRRCRRILGNEEKAVEAMQDVFVNVLKSAETLTSANPSSLLYQISTNVCLNKIRSTKRTPEDSCGEIIDEIARTSNLEAAVGARRVLKKIFHGEPESTAHMAVLHFVDGMTLEEVAEEVGMSVSGVRKRLRILKLNAKGLEV